MRVQHLSSSRDRSLVSTSAAQLAGGASYAIGDLVYGAAGGSVSGTDTRLSLVLNQEDWRLNGVPYVNPREMRLFGPDGREITAVEYLVVHRVLPDLSEEQITRGIEIQSSAFQVVAGKADSASGLVPYVIALPEGVYTLVVNFVQADTAGRVIRSMGNRNFTFRLERISLDGGTVALPTLPAK